MVNCSCGFPCATRTAWTQENSGRKFIACKFYNTMKLVKGDATPFDWVDESSTYWQRDVINVLVAEKHRISTDYNILKSRLVCVEHKKKKIS